MALDYCLRIWTQQLKSKSWIRLVLELGEMDPSNRLVQISMNKNNVITQSSFYCYSRFSCTGVLCLAGMFSLKIVHTLLSQIFLT